jgi:hypothetical protein
MTVISGAGFGGGNAQGDVCVWIGGEPFPDSSLLLQIVSADRNGDLVVDLSDLSAVPDGFAVRFLNGSYDFASDLTCDGLENLLDVAIFAVDFAASCP